jgi:multidrug resistance protein MdtO
MVTASTLVMIIGMTFRIPYTAYAALFALILSRESVAETAKAARDLVVGVILGGAYVIVGAMLVLGNPMLRFLSVGATLFLAFYTLSALSNYTAAARFAYLIVITISLWDSSDSAESKVENTLWAVGAITIGSVVTLLMELVFASFRRMDELTEGIVDRLVTVQELLDNYAEGREVPAATRSTLKRLCMVGTSRLRRILQRAGDDAHRKQQMGALVALVGRLVDVTASLLEFSGRIADEDRDRLRNAGRNVDKIRFALTSGGIPRLGGTSAEGQFPPRLPLLSEVEKTVSLICDVFTSATYANASSHTPPSDGGKALVSDALSNPEHFKFALKGC